MPYSATRAAATSSFVDSGFEAARTTSAPPALSVRIRFAVSVVTWRQAPIADPGQGLLALEPLADQAEDRHLPLRPFDAADALGGEAEVGDVVGRQASGGGGGRRVAVSVIGIRSPCG